MENQENVVVEQQNTEAEAVKESSANDEQQVEAKDNAQEQLNNVQKSQEKKANIKKLKLKIDGKEIEESLDLDNEEELAKHLQLSKAAQKRMSEAAEQRKQIEQILQVLHSNPEEVMRELGIDPEDFAVKLLNKKIEENQKSPEQREIERLQKELEQHKKTKELEAKEKRQQEIERYQREFEKQIDTDITNALEKGGLPKKPYVVKKFAENLLLAYENNIKLDVNDLIPVVRKEMMEDLRDMMSGSPDELVTELLGKDRFNSIRKKQIDSLKKQVESASQIKQTGNEVKAKQEANNEQSVKKDLKMHDFLRS